MSAHQPQPNQPRTCGTCQGSRTVRETRTENGVARDSLITCPTCRGTGRT